MVEAKPCFTHPLLRNLVFLLPHSSPQRVAVKKEATFSAIAESIFFKAEIPTSTRFTHTFP